MVRRPGWIVMGLVVSGSLLATTFGVGPRSAEAFTHTPAPVFINEIHYDNDGTDTNEAIEIAGPAGTDLTGWRVVPYNGNGGAPYPPTVPLAGVIPDQHAGFGTLSFSVPGLQNGAPDALTLVNAGGTVVQCLSYEGTFTAVGGPATGLVSTDMGVAETGTEPADESLQLTGTGTTYQHFTWSSSAKASFGVVNGGQTFGSNEPSPSPNVSPLPSSTPAPAATPSPATTRIRDIQGAAQSSPLAGQTVTNVPGIVTAVRSNGFYFQDGQPDTDERTAEAVFVFTRTAPTVPAGASVLVSGMVSEFRPGSSGGTDNLATTQLSATTVTPSSTSFGTITPTIIGEGGRTPPTTTIEDDTTSTVEDAADPAFDPRHDGIDFYESLEAMLVQINAPVVVGSTSDFGEIWVVADNGTHAAPRTPRGGIVIADDYHDFNPERIQIDDAIVGPAPNANVGDRLNTVVGVVDYSFGNFEVLNTTPLAGTSGGLQREVTTLTGDHTNMTVATFNVENLDPGDGAAKFTALAEVIVTNLQSPDVVALEEVQDNNGPTKDAVVDANATYTLLITAIMAAGGPGYEFRQINPVDDQDGGEPGGNIRVGFLFNPARVAFVDRPGATSTTPNTVVDTPDGAQLEYSPGRIDPDNPAFTNSRKPLAGEFVFNNNTVVVIVNHFNSKGGDQPLFGRFQPPARASEEQRRAQAQIVADFVRDLLAAEADAKVVVLGDLNDFEFSPAVTLVEQAGLSTLIETLPKAERYTFVFEGNSQVLDQMLVSGTLRDQWNGYDVVHVNAEFADQISDHDPQVARFTLTPSAPASPSPAPRAPASPPRLPDTGLPGLPLAGLAAGVGFVASGLLLRRRR